MTFPSSMFASYAMKMVLDDPLPDETPSHRVKQIGLLVIMQEMIVNGVETNSVNIVKHTGLSRSTLNVVVKPLLDRGILSDVYEPNRTGNSSVLRLVFSDRFNSKFATFAKRMRAA